MGRRKLLPNINNLLLQLHLPHRSGSGNENARRPSQQQDAEDGAHHCHDPERSHHHNLHIFTWPSLKRKPSTSSLASEASSEDYEDADIVTEAPTSHKSLDLSSSLSLSSSPSSSEHFRNCSSVSFGTCEVRTYTQVLGDHPCCSDGCPIQLGWTYTTQESFRIDDYETFRQETVLHELRLTPEERRHILIHCKQKQYVDNCCNNSNMSDHQTRGSEDSDIQVSPEQHQGEACETCTLSIAMNEHETVKNVSVPSSSSSTLSPVQQQHERELRRECRRMTRCGGWNVNVKASRKRNKRDQRAFFGTACSTTTKMPIAPTTSSQDHFVGCSSSKCNDTASLVAIETPVTTATAENEYDS